MLDAPIVLIIITTSNPSAFLQHCSSLKLLLAYVYLASQMAPNRILPLLTSHPHSLPFPRHCVQVSPYNSTKIVLLKVTIKPAILCSWFSLPKFLVVFCSEPFSVHFLLPAPKHWHILRLHTQRQILSTTPRFPLSNVTDSYSNTSSSLQVEPTPSSSAVYYAPQVASYFLMAPQGHYFPNQSHQIWPYSLFCDFS